MSVIQRLQSQFLLVRNIKISKFITRFDNKDSKQDQWPWFHCRCANVLQPLIKTILCNVSVKILISTSHIRFSVIFYFAYRFDHVMVVTVTERKNDQCTGQCLIYINISRPGFTWHLHSNTNDQQNNQSPISVLKTKKRVSSVWHQISLLLL